jgi:hypothetical protein
MIYNSVSLQSSWTFFAYLHVPTLITLFCDVAFKIKSLLSMVSSMYEVVQWWSIDIFSLLKICMNFDFYLIIINNYGICLWVHQCQHTKDWNVSRYMVCNLTSHSLSCFSPISMFINFSCLHILISLLNLIPFVYKSWVFCMFFET